MPPLMDLVPVNARGDDIISDHPAVQIYYDDDASTVRITVPDEDDDDARTVLITEPDDDGGLMNRMHMHDGDQRSDSERLYDGGEYDDDHYEGDNCCPITYFQDFATIVYEVPGDADSTRYWQFPIHRSMPWHEVAEKFGAFVGVPIDRLLFTLDGEKVDAERIIREMSTGRFGVFIDAEFLSV